MNLGQVDDGVFGKVLFAPCPEAQIHRVVVQVDCTSPMTQESRACRTPSEDNRSGRLD